MDDKVASEKIKSSRRPPLNYKEMGIEIGSTLQFIKDPAIEVIVSGDKRVTYESEEQSLTAVTKQLLGITHVLQPTAYWIFESKNLRDVYDETYTLEE